MLGSHKKSEPMALKQGLYNCGCVASSTNLYWAVWRHFDGSMLVGLNKIKFQALSGKPDCQLKNMPLNMHVWALIT